MKACESLIFKKKTACGYEAYTGEDLASPDICKAYINIT